MALTQLSNPIEIDKDVLAEMSRNRTEYKELMQSSKPLFIMAEDPRRGKFFIGNKDSKQYYPISKKLLN